MGFSFSKSNRISRKALASSQREKRCLASFCDSVIQRPIRFVLCICSPVESLPRGLRCATRAVFLFSPARVVGRLHPIHSYSSILALALLAALPERRRSCGLLTSHFADRCIPIPITIQYPYQYRRKSFGNKSQKSRNKELP